MFDIREVETVEAPKSLANSAIDCATVWLFVIWTCVCFGC